MYLKTVLKIKILFWYTKNEIHVADLAFLMDLVKIKKYPCKKKGEGKNKFKAPKLKGVIFISQLIKNKRNIKKENAITTPS